MILSKLFEEEQPELEKMLDDFCNLTGLAAVITDKSGTQLSKLSNASEFCAIMRTQGDLCCRSDGIGGKIAAKKGDISIYRCHAGLVDFAAPIFVSGEHIGNILAGQVITNTRLKHDLTRITANTLCIVDSDMKEKYAAISCMDHETINKCARILNILRKYIGERVIVREQENRVGTSIEAAANCDFSEPLAEIVRLVKKLEYENAKKSLLSAIRDYYEWNKKNKDHFREQFFQDFAELDLEIPDNEAISRYNNSLFRMYPESIAYHMKKPVMIVPTIASTDAPCSALAVLYTDAGVFDEYLLLPTNPTVVLMDTEIIATAPVRLLVAGMGDALATYFEARATYQANATTMAGAQPTEAAIALAELCYRTLLSDGLKAKLAVESNVSNMAVEKIIEANTYLSGIGFESGGLAGAHAIHNGLTVLEDCHHLYHGEKVAFGTLAQLVLENAPLEELEEVIPFCQSLGLPTTLKELNADKATEAQLREVAVAASVAGETIHNMPFPVTANDVYAAIVTVDKLSQQL